MLSVCPPPGDSPATETLGGSLVLGWSCPGVLSPSEVVCVFHQRAVWDEMHVSGRGFLSLVLVLGVEEIQ